MDRSTPTIAKSGETQSAETQPAALPSEPELTQYRAISYWAVATLFAGLAAPLALVGPLLWWVPLATIPLAILAFRQLRQPDPRYVGKTAAVCGICLAALFLAWGVTQRLSRESYLAAEVRRFSDEYLELLLTGRTREAHQIQSPAARRVQPGSDLVSYYEATAEPGRELAAYSKLEPVASLVGQQGKIELEFAEVTRHLVEGPTDYFTLRYEVTRGTIPGSSGSLWVSAKRDRHHDSLASDWQINSLSLTEPAGN